jgi:hypothetical protein
MRIHNLYEDANGESHFRDIEVDWVDETPSGKLSKRLPATGQYVATRCLLKTLTAISRPKAEKLARARRSGQA